MICYARSITFCFVVVVSGMATLPAEELMPPEILDQGAARTVWERLIESRSNLAVLDRAKLIVGVPAVPSGDGVAPYAAAAGSLVQYWDKEKRDLSGKREELAVGIRDYLKQRAGGKEPEDYTEVVFHAWEELCKEYNADLLAAAVAMNRRFTEGECYVRALQKYSERLPDGEPLQKAATAVQSFANSRDLNVTAAVKSAQWNECCESLTRDMPFLCSFGPEQSPRIYLCVGFAEGNGKRYLIAIAPASSRTRIQTIRRVGRLAPAPDANGGTNVGPGQSGITHRSDERINATPDAPPGIVVLRVPSEPVRCLFVHTWVRDQVALAKRIDRLAKTTQKDAPEQEKEQTNEE